MSVTLESSGILEQVLVDNIETNIRTPVGLLTLHQA